MKVSSLLRRMIWWRPERAQSAPGPDAFVGADVPIRSSGQDRLRRINFAERIAGVLSALSLEEGRVFAIRGGWGFGKSSLKHLVIERLESRESGADWLDFNPWQWGDGDAIARALFREIANCLGGIYSTDAAKRAEKLRRYGAILTGAAKPLKETEGRTELFTTVLMSTSVIALASAVGFSLPTVAKFAAAIGVLAGILPLVGKILAYFGRDRSAEPLDSMRRSLEGSLRELSRPLVIFVDDIDRLEPEQIRLLLRQVKANANLPNLVFVLIYQPSIVEAALDPIAGGDGGAFLEKVIQANFDLPSVPAATVHKIFTEQLSELASVHATEENGFQQVRWGNCLIGCIQPYLRNLRDASRLLSSIAVHIPLHVGSGAFEVNIVDFLVLETMRVFEPELHGLLFREQDLVLQSRRYRNDGRNDLERPRIKALLDVVEEEPRGVVEQVLKELFPQIAWVFENMHYGSDWHQQWTNEKRICSSRFFSRYFELQTPEGELSESAFVSILAITSNAGALANAITAVEERGLLPALAKRMDGSVDRLPVENASVLLPAMFEVGQKLAAARSVDPFNSPWVSAWRAASWFLKKIPSETRGDMAVEALRSTRALSVGAILIHLNDPEDARQGDRDNFDPALDAGSVRAMKAEWLHQVSELAKDPDRMLGQSDLASLLYRWRDYAGSIDVPKAWVATAISTEARFATLVERIMSRGTTSGWGDRVSAPYDTFNKETIEELIGLDTARARAEAIDLDRLSVGEAHAVRTLLRFLDGWRDGTADD